MPPLMERKRQRYERHLNSLFAGSSSLALPWRMYSNDEEGIVRAAKHKAFSQTKEANGFQLSLKAEVHTTFKNF